MKLKYFTFMEIRNQFMHNIKIRSYEHFFTEYLSDKKKYVLSHYKTDKKIPLESHLELATQILARAAQMQREDKRDVISPEAELRHGEKSGDENPDLDRAQRIRVIERGGNPPEENRHDVKRGNLKHTKQCAAATTTNGRRKANPSKGR